MKRNTEAQAISASLRYLCQEHGKQFNFKYNEINLRVTFIEPFVILLFSPTITSLD